MKKTDQKHTAVLQLYCPDREGILAAISNFINSNNGNIIYLEQYVDRVEKVFYMRVEWEISNFAILAQQLDEYIGKTLAVEYKMEYTLHFSTKKPRMAVFVSKLSHCLYDILSRTMAKEWDVELPLIISNHPDMEKVAKQFGIPYYYLPITKENKAEQEAKQLALLAEHEIDFVVLARYMQVLSPNFVAHYPNKIINIHHSFLPAFAGAKPYHAAHARGVKIIGATSHYVTSDLDAGPIIAQNVARCSHVDTVDSLVSKGRDLEKIVFSHAIAKHIEHKVLVRANKTVVFN